MAFVPETSGKTSPFSAIASSLGTRDGTEIMFGLILSPTDDVLFPDGTEKYRVAVPKKAGQSLPDFVVPNTRYSRDFFFAITVFGVGQDEQAARGAASEPAVRVELAVKTPITTNQVQQLTVDAYDKSGVRVFPAGGYSFESDSSDVVEIIPGGRAAARKPGGPVKITVRTGSVSDSKTITVKAP